MSAEYTRVHPASLQWSEIFDIMKVSCTLREKVYAHSLMRTQYLVFINTLYAFDRLTVAFQLRFFYVMLKNI